jgi:hypothetical protein
MSVSLQTCSGLNAVPDNIVVSSVGGGPVFKDNLQTATKKIHGAYENKYVVFVVTSDNDLEELVRSVKNNPSGKKVIVLDTGRSVSEANNWAGEILNLSRQFGAGIDQNWIVYIVR